MPLLDEDRQKNKKRKRKQRAFASTIKLPIFGPNSGHPKEEGLGDTSIEVRVHNANRDSQGSPNKETTIMEIVDSQLAKR